jgi:hypothetical protein
MAGYALLHHQDIDMDVKIMLMKNKESSWTKMKERLQEAVITPQQKFTQSLTANKQQPGKNKGKGFRR